MNDPHRNRPPLLSFVCYLVIMGMAIMLAVLLAMLGNPVVEKKLDVPSEVVLPCVSMVLGIFFAGFMLIGKNWARIGFFVLYGSSVIFLQIVDLSVISVVSAVLFVFCALLLCRRRAHCYFTGRNYHAEMTQVATRKREAEKQPPHSNRFNY